MQEPPWLPRTNEEYLQQLAADAGPQPDEFIALQAELEAADGEIAHLNALLAERDAEIKGLREAGQAYRAALAEYEREWDGESDQQWRDRMDATHQRVQETHDALVAALAARGGAS